MQQQSFSTSSSYNLLQTAYNLPSSYYDFHSCNNNVHERNDSIPIETQRFMARYLSLISNPFISAEELFSCFQRDEYINEKRKILSRTYIITASRRCNKAGPSNYLQRLPNELLFMIMKNMLLEPGDVICLGLTCREMFHKVDFQLVDIRNMIFASSNQLRDVLVEHGFRAALAKERYGVTKRLDRDRTEILEASTFLKRRGGDELACSVCVALHPKWWFSAEQRCVSANVRCCLAALAEVRICEHWTENLISLRRLREKAICEKSGMRYQIRTCQHPDHHNSNNNNGFSEPHMVDFGSGWSINRSITLLQAAEKTLITKDLVREALKSRAEVTICPHLNLSSPPILESFEKKSVLRKEDFPESLQRWGVHLPEFESTSCEKCGIAFQFSIFDSGKRSYSLQQRYALKLNVDEQFEASKDPWANKWLEKVQGGEALKRIKAM